MLIVAGTSNLQDLAGRIMADSMSLEEIESTIGQLTASELEQFYAIMDTQASRTSNALGGVYASSSYWGDAHYDGYTAELLEIGYASSGNITFQPSYYWYSTTWCDGDEDSEIIVRVDFGQTGYDVTNMFTFNTDPDINFYLMRHYSQGLSGWRRTLDRAVNDRYYVHVYR